MKYLCVAEKNDAAKTISQILSRGSSNRREGFSPYNKIYEFDCQVRGQNTRIVMTSVSGHLLTHEFVQSFRNWRGCSPEQLFEAQVIKTCPENFVKIQKTLEREVRSCNSLIIWTDCDREGENIGFEIIEVCRKVKPSIPIYRAKFSEITAASIHRALNNLEEPDLRQSQAVDVRSELDLRIGAAFTRFQTMRLQQVFPNQVSNNLVSYGSCQIPTLGFVAQRYKEVENFIAQAFWKIKFTHKIEDLTVEFNWARNRLFDKQCCEALLILCQEAKTAMITNVTQKPKSKWRPLPMDTIELEKSGVRKLKLNAKTVMTIAEKLYTQGFISYPRTETNIFSKDMKLRDLVELHTPHPEWGNFAQQVLEWGPNPRSGTKSDQAHPPIHPTKFTTGLSGDEKRVYELVCRHFLACVSRDAKGSETTVTAEIANEEFTATGLMILERNYLEVYVYDRWSDKEVHHYEIGNTFEPTELSLHEGSTTAPNMLTEADLIALMEKHGIGTDATHAEHINTIKERGYIGELDRGFLLPGTLGMGLVEGYEAMELELSQPRLRAQLEIDLKLICEGRKDPKDVLREQVEQYKQCYRIITEKARLLDRSLSARFNEDAQEAAPMPANVVNEPIFKCPKCQNFKMALKQRPNSAGFYVGCEGFPNCKNAIWLSELKEIQVTNEDCGNCAPGNKKVKMKFKQNHFLASVGNTRGSRIDGFNYTTCFVCDEQLRNLLNINVDCVKRLGSVVDVRRVPTQNPANSNFRHPANSGNSRNFGNDQGNRGNSGNFGSIQGNSRNNNPENRNNQPGNNQNRGWGSQSNNNNIPPGNQGNRGNPGNNQNRGWGNQSNSNQNDWGDDDDDDFFGGGGGGAVAVSSTNNRPTSSGWNSNSSSNSTSSWGRTANPPNTDWRTSNDWSNPPANNPPAKKKRQSYPILDIKCTACGVMATRKFVKKEGPNQGRPFYSCDAGCKFFKWGDENLPPETADSGASGSGSGRRTGQPRRCGICRQEGHTKNKCPQRNTDL